jgi:tungstate transport system ATP-binding protein
VLAVIGPNGAGKSTLLRVMALLEAPTRGRVLVDGELVTGARALALRRRMASAFQEPLLADATVADNVAMGLRFRGVPPAEVRARVARWLDRFGIAALAARQARTLSGGEAQRTSLARALVLEPALLLLDEPFSSLDQPTREVLLGELRRILREDARTTVLVTHDRGEALALGDRVAVMMDGRLCQVDETSAVFRAPATAAVARFVGVETIVEGAVWAVRDRLTGVAVGEVIILAEQRALAEQHAEPGERVRVCVRAEDVTLTVGPARAADAASAENHLCGRLVGFHSAGAHVRVVIDCGFPLVALSTRRAVDDLRLRDGAVVTAHFRAGAVHLLRDAAPHPGTEPQV